MSAAALHEYGHTVLMRDMRVIQISDAFALPVDVVTETIAILARKRAGKSYTARKIVEGLLRAHQQVVVVDPKGDWFGLRSSADGASPGFPILIAGGEHADVPIEATSGETLATFVIEQRLSLLLDLSSFRKHQVATFMAGFMETLYRLRGREKNRTPMMLVIDEADAIAPQRPGENEARMLGATEDIVRRGGQRGIGCMLVSQRAAVLNKNVLTQAQILIALRTMSPQDLTALDDWVKVHGTPEQRVELFASLPSLPIGDAWVWSPGWPTLEGIFERVSVGAIETFDSGATPKVGQKVAPPKTVAEVDLTALTASLASTIAKAKADDPRELRKQISELQQELRAKDAHPIMVSSPPEVREIIPSDFVQALRAFRAQMTEVREELDLIVEKAILTENSQKSPISPEMWPKTAEKRRNGPNLAEEAVRTPVFREKQPENGENGLSGPQQKIINVLGRLEALGLLSASRAAVAGLSGYSLSGNFQNLLGKLRSQGLIEYPAGNMLGLTRAGRDAAEYIEGIDTVEDLHNAWFDRLGPPRTRILRVLIGFYPDGVARNLLAEHSGYSLSGNFQNLIGSLHTLGLVVYPERGFVAASEVLFPALPGAARG